MLKTSYFEWVSFLKNVGMDIPRTTAFDFIKTWEHFVKFLSIRTVQDEQQVTVTVIVRIFLIFDISNYSSFAVLDYNSLNRIIPLYKTKINCSNYSITSKHNRPLVHDVFALQIVKSLVCENPQQCREVIHHHNIYHFLWYYKLFACEYPSGQISLLICLINHHKIVQVKYYWTLLKHYPYHSIHPSWKEFY